MTDRGFCKAVERPLGKLGASECYKARVRLI